MHSPITLFRRQSAAVMLLAMMTAMLSLFAGHAEASTAIRNGADPTIMTLGNTYYSVESLDSGLWVRKADSVLGLGADGVTRIKVWSDPGYGEIWAPEIKTENGKVYIFFSAGVSEKHRMYVIWADTPLGTYSTEVKLNLPDDQWAIDGTYFIYKHQRYFVWSGWISETDNTEQNLYICKMNSPSEATGSRYIISQPHDWWENAGDHPLINEGPEAIIDPHGRLHIVYSANGSWGDKYCLGDIRLIAGGDPTSMPDWHKSNGCLFGYHQEYMMSGWNATANVTGPGHHTFIFPGADINRSPGWWGRNEFVFGAVPRGTPYEWDNRNWYTGSWVWRGNTVYTRDGAKDDVGVSFKFSE